MNLILKASEIAYEAHKGQFRKYGHVLDPYVLHPMRVSGLIQIACPERVTDEMIAAAWLHDVVEDTYMDFQHLERSGIPIGVIEIVKSLTRNKTKGTREDRVSALIEKMRRAHWKVRLIKLADRVDNLGDSYGDTKCPVKFKKMYAKEGLRLMEAMGKTNTFLEARLILLAEGILQGVG